MMKKTPFALLALSLLAGGLATLYGCGGSGQAGTSVVNAPVGEPYESRAVDLNKIVDSQDSWRRFVAEAKQAERMKAAEKHFQEGGPANKVQIRFMKDEMEYVQFGNNSKLKDIDPNRLYEVGVITLAAKETWGGDGYQIREYVLKFITPRRDGNWHFVTGTYHVTKFQGALAADPTQLRYVEDKEYQNGYLRDLFIEPMKARAASSAPVATDGEAPVETQAVP